MRVFDFILYCLLRWVSKMADYVDFKVILNFKIYFGIMLSQK